MPRVRVVQRRETHAARAAARAPLGPLRHLLVTPTRLRRYATAVNLFVLFCNGRMLMEPSAFGGLPYVSQRAFALSVIYFDLRETVVSEELEYFLQTMTATAPRA